MPHLKSAWNIVIPHAWNWILVTLFYMYLLTVGIGLLFFPNMVRIARKAADQGTPPNVGDLFYFDDFADDALTVIIQKMVIMAGLCLCLIGSPILALMLYWSMHLAADGLFAPLDCIKAAFLYGKSNFLLTFVNIVVIHVVVYTAVFFTCGFGMLLGLPIIIVALERLYRSELPAILAAADAAGIPRKA